MLGMFPKTEVMGYNLELTFNIKIYINVSQDHPLCILKIIQQILELVHLEKQRIERRSKHKIDK